MPEEAVEAVVAAWFGGERVGDATVRRAAQRRTLGAVNGDANEVRRGLCLAVIRSVRRLDRFRRARPIDRGDVGDAFQLDVRRTHGAEVTPGARVWNPWSRWIVALSVDQVVLVLRGSVECLGEVGPVGE